MNPKDLQREACPILIVDDEISLRNTFRVFLEREGYLGVEAVATFNEALEAVARQDFQLIICDIVLESLSGIDLLKTLREKGVQCPIVMVTGYPHVETASEAVRLGAFDYLAKPVEKEQLLKTARLAIGHYHMETRKKQAEIEQQQARHFLETVFSSVSDAIISVTRELDVLMANEAANQLIPELSNPGEKKISLEKACQSRGLSPLVGLTKEAIASATRLSDHRMEYRHRDNSLLLSICISPLHLSQGDKAAVTGAVIVLRDISYKLVSRPENQKRFHKMIGCSRAMGDVFMLIENIGRVDSSVLITGASGTGKELAAHALHQESPRKNKPLVKVDCTAITDNLMESELFGHKKGSFTGATEDRSGRIVKADGGTLFLDEIGDISPTMQLRLLRFLQERSYYPVGRDREIQVDVRVIAATNADLKKKVRDGHFREDLYYRLLIIELSLPPLCERHGDITLLTNHFIQHFAGKLGKPITGITDQAMSHLCQYRWPGNVRQLEHTIERACVLSKESTLSSASLPEEITTPSVKNSGHEPIRISDQQKPHHTNAVSPAGKDRVETAHSAEMIVDALRKTGGNKAKAARLLGIDRSTLYRKIHELHIDTGMFSF